MSKCTRNRTFKFHRSNQFRNRWISTDLWWFSKCQCMRNHRSISFDGAKRKYLIIKKIDEKIRYASSRRIEGINFPSNTPIREEFTSSIIDCSSGLSPCRSNEGWSPDRKAFLLQRLPDNGQTCNWNIAGSAWSLPLETEDLICEEVSWDNRTGDWEDCWTTISWATKGRSGLCYTNSPWFSPIFGESEWEISVSVQLVPIEQKRVYWTRFWIVNRTHIQRESVIVSGCK